MSAVRHALIVSTGRPVPPFDDAPGEAMILNRTLRTHQEDAIAAAGLSLVDAPPDGAPYLMLSDRTWVTGQTLKLFMAQASPPARLKCEHPEWLAITAPLQDLPEPGVYEVALVPAGGAPEFSQIPAVPIDLDVQVLPAPEEHPVLQHALPQAIAATDAPVHQIDHWTHILRANWLAIAGTIAAQNRAWKDASIFGKAWRILVVLLKGLTVGVLRSGAPPWTPWPWGRAVNQIGARCQIHPTAVVEVCVIGDDVQIGPGAVVRGSVIGDGVKIEEQAIINLSVIGDGAKIGRRATSNLVVAYPGAFFGAANGYQATVFGRDSFAAWTVTVFDLAFDKHVKVWYRGERVDSGTYFLGAAIGHRARLGGLVTLGYGAEVPNDAFVVGESAGVLRAWEDGPSPHRVSGGVARPVKRRTPRADEGGGEE